MSGGRISRPWDPSRMVGVGELGEVTALVEARAEIERLRTERDQAAEDADRNSCQGGWRLAQERAVRIIELEAEVDRARRVARAWQHLARAHEESYARLRAAVDVVLEHCPGDAENAGGGA